ncbi:hypothetical protein ACSBR1_038031 [Camellia fascicularis]
MIPKSIGKLKNLETLDQRDTYVTELPDEIPWLEKLCHLLLYHFVTKEVEYYRHRFGCISGFKAPLEIGSLQSLQKLYMIELDQRNRGGIVKESLSPVPQFLLLLYLNGHLTKFPHWIPSVYGFATLHLRWSKLRDDPLQFLQELPNLVELVLDQAYEGKGLCFKATGFQTLNLLSLYKLKELRWVRVEEGVMPHLQTLVITNSELVDEVPFGIKHLTNLQMFRLFDMSKELIMKLDREVQGGDY